MKGTFMMCLRNDFKNKTVFSPKLLCSNKTTIYETAKQIAFITIGKANFAFF